MSIKKAQEIVNYVDCEFGFSMVAYETSQLKHLKEQLEKFLKLEVETENLQDPGDILYNEDGSVAEDEEWTDEDYAGIEDDINADFE